MSVPWELRSTGIVSSMSAIQMGYYQIKAGEADCIMAGGADSMSTAPIWYLMPDMDKNMEIWK